MSFLKKTTHDTIDLLFRVKFLTNKLKKGKTFFKILICLKGKKVNKSRLINFIYCTKKKADANYAQV